MKSPVAIPASSAFARAMASIGVGVVGLGLWLAVADPAPRRGRPESELGSVASVDAPSNAAPTEGSLGPRSLVPAPSPADGLRETVTESPPDSPIASVPSGSVRLSIRGRIVDAESNPLVGATISGYGLDGKVVEIASGPDGRFEYPCHGNHPAARLTVRHPGHATEVLEWDEAPCGAESVDVVLGRGGTVRGAVRNLSGEPLEGARIALDTRTSWRSGNKDYFPHTAPEMAATGIDGTYELPHVPDGTARILATKHGHEIESATVDVAEGGEHRLDFAIRRLGIVRGLVVDCTTGLPLESVNVRGSSTSTSSDRDGRFEATLPDPEDLTRGRHGDVFVGGVHLYVDRPGFLPLQCYFGTKDLGSELRLALEPAAEVRARVRDSQGRPLNEVRLRFVPDPPNAVVSLCPGPRDSQNMRGADSLVTDSNGFATGRVAAGSYESVLFLHTSRAETRLPGPTLHVGENDLLEYVLEDGVDLRGRVLAASDGAPVGRARVVLYRRVVNDGAGRLHPYLRAFTDASGGFELCGLEPGPASVSVATSRGTLGPTTISVQVPDRDGRLDPLEIRLTEGVAFRGVVVDPSGTPIVGASVTTWSTNEDPAFAFLRGGETFRTETNAAGEFRLDRLPRVPLGISVRPASDAFDSFESLEIPERLLPTEPERLVLPRKPPSPWDLEAFRAADENQRRETTRAALETMKDAERDP
jgi:protocatechuate 3,4-dioxygenase beta subunit